MVEVLLRRPVDPLHREVVSSNPAVTVFHLWAQLLIVIIRVGDSFRWSEAHNEYMKLEY